MNQQEQQQIRERLNGPETLDWTDTPRSTLIDRIIDKIEVNPETGCWEWRAAAERGGYARMRVDYITSLAHRLTYRLAHGSIPDGKQINHTCHRKFCVASHHIYAGSHQENVLDAIRADAWPHETLAESDVREIRERYATNDEATTVVTSQTSRENAV